jgi:hypothetical protein
MIIYILNRFPVLVILNSFCEYAIMISDDWRLNISCLVGLTFFDVEIYLVPQLKSIDSPPHWVFWSSPIGVQQILINVLGRLLHQSLM